MSGFRRIAVLMGGRSAGREVSLSSGRGVRDALAEEGFEHVIFVMPNVSDLEPFDLLATRIIPIVEKM